MEAGRGGFQGFLIHSGVDEFPMLLKGLRRHPAGTGERYDVHAELRDRYDRAAAPVASRQEKQWRREGFPSADKTFLESRPELMRTRRRG